MTMKIVNSAKYVGLLTLILISAIACEKDFENIGVGLVDNNQFTTKIDTFEVIAYNQDVLLSRVDGIPQYPIGVYKDDNFGILNTSFVSQLGLPASSDFGDNVSIDTIVLTIPYYVTAQEDNSNGTRNYKLDSIIGDQDVEYLLSVYESGTFLNSLDPLDPTKGKKYYSNESYNEKTLLYSDQFKPNKNDTVLYVKRRFLDDDRNTVDDIDTIKTELVKPSIKIPLDTVFFRNNFVNQQGSGVFESFDNFIDHFRGVLIKAEGTEGSLMTLEMTDADITIYYTNIVINDENDSGIDLNGDGDTTDTEVPVRTKQQMTFSLGGLRASQYNRDYTGSAIQDRILTPNTANGEKRLYIQGAAGSMAIIDLSKGLDEIKLNEIRDNNWLINEANLILYVDETNKDSVPSRLQLYNLDYNSQIRDVFTEAQISGIGGFLEIGDDKKPLKYEFRITDYISEVLKSDDPAALVKLGLKVFHPTDIPSGLTANDTINKDFSWRAKGVVLKGNDLLEGANDYNERLKL